MNPEITFSFLDGVQLRQMIFKKSGDVMQGHKHNHHHITLLASGSIKIVVEGESTEYTSPATIFIHKDHLHELTALEDNTIAYCIHAVRNKETGEIIDGPEEITRTLSVPMGVEIEPIRVLDNN